MSNTIKESSNRVQNRISKYKGFRESLSDLENGMVNSLPLTFAVSYALAFTIVVPLMVVPLYFAGAFSQPKPKPPVYRDVNGDGIVDKIIQKKRGSRYVSTLEEEILYGVDINGKRIYLPKEQIDELK